ncbi:glycosyltransferase family 39 protein [Candidatus Leptofilum sp.]|uniref:glycosyltransferase family 39 protein n=1 Tax=Candidatus Leptofilum sp. TaxID=3241576 RepID=UPI003B5CBABD
MMNWQSVWQKRPLPPLLLILLLAFGLRLIGLDSQSLWWDELKTIQRAAMAFPHLMTDLAGHRAHLPLYFMVMQLWHGLGESAFVVRFFSVIWGVVGIAGIFQLGKHIANKRVGLLAALLLAISPFYIWYSQEARMYSFLPALLILAHWALAVAIQKKKLLPWLLYALLMIAAVATHYFSLFVIIAHYIFFVLHFRQLRPQTIRWFLTMLLVGLCLLPLAWFVFTSGNGEAIATVPAWIASIQWSDPLLTIWNFSIGPGIGLGEWYGYSATAVFLFAFVIAMRPARRRKTDQVTYSSLFVRLFIIWFSLPLGLTFLVSLNWPFLPDNPFSLYLDRYLIISLPPFLLMVAWGIDDWATKPSTRFAAAKRWLQSGFILMAMVISGISIWQLNHNPNHLRNDWRSALERINEYPTNNTVVLGQQDIVLPIDYYGDTEIVYVQLPPPDGAAISTSYIAAIRQQIETAVQHSPTAWHIEPFYNHDTHQFPETRRQQLANDSESMAQSWLMANFTMLAQHRLPGIRLTLFELEAGLQN